MVPGPAGEGGGASEGCGAEDTVSWAVAVLPPLLVLVVTIQVVRWRGSSPAVSIVSPSVLICYQWHVHSRQGIT